VHSGPSHGGRVSIAAVRLSWSSDALPTFCRRSPLPEGGRYGRSMVRLLGGSACPIGWSVQFLDAFLDDVLDAVR
jgi:hypothetical protein